MYEKNFKTLKEAKKSQKIVGGKISTIISIDENNNPIVIYVLKYKELF